MPANYNSSATLPGVSGTGILSDFSEHIRNSPPKMGAYEATSGSNTVDLYIGNALQASYVNIKAAFDKINDGTHTGSLILKITGSQILPSSAVLNASGKGSANYTSVNIYPTTTGLTISGNLPAPLIDFNGADNIVLDGRVNGAGSDPDLIITNTTVSGGAGTSTVRFINDASANTIKYCFLKGSTTDVGAGIVFLSKTYLATGNDNNAITNNNITCAADANRPVNAIYSVGSGPGSDNSGNTFNDNHIYDFLNRGFASNGINLGSYNSASTISGNSFYETASFVPTADVIYSAVTISAATGTNFTVSGNYIGGSAANCGSAPWTKTAVFSNLFTGISLTAGTGIASNIQGNTIKNFAYSNFSSSGWYGISVGEGDVNIGTANGNTIGASTGNNSIIFSDFSGSSIFDGIYINSNGTVNARNNTVGSVTLSTTQVGFTTFSGIYVNGVATGTITILNNIIGSTDAATSNSINSTSEAKYGSQAMSMYGIKCSGWGVNTISGNTISKLRNGTINASAGVIGQICGIYLPSNAGKHTIANNAISDLTIANANTASTNEASVIGIAILNYSAVSHIVKGNTIKNLSNTYPSFAGNVIGISYFGTTTAGTIYNNFIQGLSVSGATSTTASIYGIKSDGGANSYYNNLIHLGGNTPTTIYGFYETGAASNNNSLYFNTVSIDGSLGSGATNKSYALYSAASTNTRDFRNNLFSNSRSTADGVSLHYAAWFNYAASTSLTLGYNNYYAPGTGGVLGYYNSADVTSLPLITGIDAGSMAIDPLFATPGGTSSTDYYPSATVQGVTGTGILSDLAENIRDLAAPKMGALENGSLPGNTVDVYTGGTLQASYGNIRSAFDKINDGTHTGNIVLKITGSQMLATTASLNESGMGGASYTAITIYPTVDGLSITGNLAAPLIDLNGADNVTFDGRVNGEGSAISLILANTSKLAFSGISTIRFINDATHNTVKYCTLKGATTSITDGILSFGTTTASTGNDYNTIDHNNITGSSDNDRPANAIYSAGTVSKENDHIAIINNNLYDFFNKGSSSFGVYLSANTTACTILGNSFYETTQFAPTIAAVYTIISIANVAGVNFTISDNYFGGNGPLCSGTWTKTSSSSNFLTVISLQAGYSTTSNIQGNTIKNLDFSNVSAVYVRMIYVVDGSVNIGTTKGNVIGAVNGNGSIKISGGSGSQFFGLQSDGNGVLDAQNNSIGSITYSGANASASCSFYGIFRSTSNKASTIKNNLIGSIDENTTNSINISSTATTGSQNTFGIQVTGYGPSIVSNNTISQLLNGSTNSNTIYAGTNTGIFAIGYGTMSIENNTVRDLINGNAYNTADYSASLIGIVSFGYGSSAMSATNNTVYNLSNSYLGFTGSVMGLYCYSFSPFPSTVSGNFISRLSVTAGSTAASLYGIKAASGSANYTNNIITLGGDTKTTIYGINETGAANTINNFYFNTVSIGGSLVTGALNKSYGLFSALSTNTRDFRNNIFSNTRSTAGGTSLHYSASFNYGVSDNLTLSNNDYFKSGTGGVLGYYNSANVNALPLIATLDVNSLKSSPGFTTPGGTLAADYKITSPILVGATGTGITTDYEGLVTRSTTYPAIGAWEAVVSPALPIVEVISSLGTTTPIMYYTLREAFAAINLGTHQGVITVKIKGSTTETASAVLYQSGYSSVSSYESVTIYPTVRDVSISGDIVGALIDLDGATNVTIDGRVNQAGEKSLTIVNTSVNTGATPVSAIRLINSAQNNLVQYCTIKASAISLVSAVSNSGVVLFSTSTVTGGNSSNTIDHCDITTADQANRPYQMVYSKGTSGFENKLNTISNCNICDFFKYSATSNGIFISSYSSDWTITGNNLYETQAVVPTGEWNYYYIRVDNLSGTNFIVSNNYIGGTASDHTGTWTVSRPANSISCYCIYLNVGNTTASSIQNNTISNMDFTSNSYIPWSGIYITNGAVNIGTITGNTIGSSTGTGSLKVTSYTTAGSTTFPIYILGTGDVNVKNNKIGSITMYSSSANYSQSFYGIYNSSTGTVTIQDNIIGSKTTPFSIEASSPCTTETASRNQCIVAIYSNGTGHITVSGNSIANLKNGSISAYSTDSSGSISGIYMGNGIGTVTNNTIHDLTIGNANRILTDLQAVAGISVGNTATVTQITGNEIYNLSNTRSDFAGSISGLFYKSTATSVLVSGNFVYGLSVAEGSTAAKIYGMSVTGPKSLSNNIISLGGNTQTTIYGIYETGATGNNNIYFNTVSIKGSLVTGALNKSYALYSLAATGTRDFRNNVFSNSRSTDGGASLHYGAAFGYGVPDNLTLGYNDYYTPGAGGVLGYYNAADVAASPLIATLDDNSISVIPQFTKPGGDSLRRLFAFKRFAFGKVTKRSRRNHQGLFGDCAQRYPNNGCTGGV